MASPAVSKKRKRVLDEAPRATFALSAEPVSQLGPVLANFPLQPSKSIAYKCYLTKEHTEDDDAEKPAFAEQPILIAGEGNAVEFYTSDETQRAPVGCRYLVGVHNKRTGITKFREAPLHILAHEVKALKGIDPTAVSSLQRLEARAALGETFGTKKAKLAIRAQARNKVDVSAMEGVTDHIQESIQKNTQALPTKDEAKAAADSTRLVPAYNADALSPEEIYPRSNIIPDMEWKVLSVSSLTAAQSTAERIALLPFKRSNWVNEHLSLAFAGPTPKRDTLKMLLYISSIFAFRSATFKKIEKTAIQEKLSAVPSVVIDGLLSRFTETARGSTEARMTSQTETLLLTSLFALCLQVDDFATDTTLIAGDLSQPVTKINTLFKSLGCKISKPSQADLKRLGLPDSAGETKRAMLKVPLEFPKPRARRRT
ncbi:Rpa49 subunit specific to nuclear RNA polymerase I [Hygrophoropsis aurantiaca]|uniref:Rpa49 subunit specific to nuclear RNA polymerase I n=1 Tax=Hygrophoropsis aurantiaca TaxID=72124 RepID=A0ACB8A142_9AGAM|nr:Rpa49 subunit specific to nuclear RNA polymerase I [Hygrophoropsis aurantiaca]